MRRALLAAVFIIASASRAFAATHLGIQIPRYVTHEAETSFVVTARSDNGTRLADYRGTVHFSGDPSIDLPADYTFTEADAGQHTFTAVFHRGYSMRFEVSDDTGAIDSAAEVYVLCPEITLSATYDHPMCSNPGSTVTLSASTNATSPEFLWQNTGGGPESSQTGQTVTVAIGGKWQVGMTDAATGCYTAILLPVPYERGPDIDAPSQAYGDFTASIANASGGPYTDIEWQLGTGGTIVSGQGTHTVTIHPTSASIDLYVAANRTSTGCRVTSSAYTSIVPVPLSAAITADAEVCPNATGRTASVPDSGAGTTYQWTIEQGQIVSGQGTREIVFNAPASGSVQLGVVVQRSGYGMSGSASVMIGPTAEIVSADAGICSGAPATINAALTGTTPFRVVWSDGVEQTGILSSSVSRSVAPDEATSYSIISVSDAMCAGNGSGDVFVDLLEEPEIVQQPVSKTIAPGKTATLSVVADGASRYRWYQGASGDRSHLVAGGFPTFTTPKLTKTTSYWVEVESDCGMKESTTAVVTVATSSKRRAARR